jgi:hypothetical protein
MEFTLIIYIGKRYKKLLCGLQPSSQVVTAGCFEYKILSPYWFCHSSYSRHCYPSLQSFSVSGFLNEYVLTMLPRRRNLSVPFGWMSFRWLSSSRSKQRAAQWSEMSSFADKTCLWNITLTLWGLRDRSSQFGADSETQKRSNTVVSCHKVVSYRGH